MPTPLHPEAVALLAAINAAPVDYSTSTVRDIRARAARFPAPQPDWYIHPPRRDRLCHATCDIPLKIYWPQKPEPPGEDTPAIVYFHGGGWSMNSVDDFDALCQGLSNAANMPVFSVDYPLAPETRFPNQVTMGVAAVDALRNAAQRMRIDPQKLIVAGDSAGGNLAAAVSLMCRDTGIAPPVHQILIYPVLAYGCETEAFARLGDGYLLNRSGMMWCWHQYLVRPEEGQSPYAAALNADDLAGMPPTLVVSATYDPLIDEARMFAERMAEDGADCTLLTYPSIHGFMQFVGVWDIADQAMGDIGDHLHGVMACAAAPR